MTTTQIGWVGLAASLVLVLVALGLSVTQRLRLERSILWASARAAVQLAIVGWALRVVLDPDAPMAWSWAWVVAMVIFVGFTVRRRAPEVPGVWWLGSLSMAAVVTVSTAVIFGFGIFPLEGRTLVPLAGMMIGNSMTSCVLVGRRIVEVAADRRRDIEARLALGLAPAQAVRPHVRAAIRLALIPQVESTKAVGLVFLPGAMTGLVLAGVDAGDAVTIQLAIMYLVLGSVATSVVIMGFGVSRRLFTADERLTRLVRAED